MWFKASFSLVYILGTMGLVYLAQYVTVESAVRFLWFWMAYRVWAGFMSFLLPRVSK